jgi:membrane-associated phospholipid phosphatase
MKEEIASRPSVKSDYRSPGVLGVVFPAIYASILCIFCLIYKVFPGPEFIVLCFFIYAAYSRRSRRFVRDWVPFVSFFLSYEAMYGIVGTLSGIVHVQEPVIAELQMFGSIPTLLLQHLYRTPVLDYLGAFFYSLHFIAPTVFGFLLWKYNPRNYRRYALVLAISTYSALITFLLYPVAPPWFGVKATRILFQVDNNLGMPVYRTIFEYFQSNPFAAFPSLHAMYPWIISLYAMKIKKAKALPVLLFPMGVWFSAVYLGEHYVVDLAGGVIYAMCAFLLVEKLFPPLFQRIRAYQNAQQARDRSSFALRLFALAMRLSESYESSDSASSTHPTGTPFKTFNPQNALIISGSSPVHPEVFAGLRGTFIPFLV